MYIEKASIKEMNCHKIALLYVIKPDKLFA